MSWLILNGDWIEMLRTLPDESIHCIVTSPPYWGLRDYGTAKWEGGDPDCQHRRAELRRGVNLAESAASTRGGGIKAAKVGYLTYSHRCEKCGAVRIDQQLGLEPTIDEYLAKVVAGFREARRVLRSDGTLWLNIGDSYATSGRGGNPTQETSRLEGGQQSQRESMVARSRSTPYGWKSKDLIGIPWMVAFALRADGWYLRQDIIWAKPNPMPESVGDRCTKAHEYIFLLSKSAKYFYDKTAIEEPVTGNAHGRGDGVNPKAKKIGQHSRITQDRDPRHLQYAKRPRQNESFSAAVNSLVTSRNKRSVWEIATSPYPEAHFATFPPKLVEPCIMAGTSERGCCPQCGAPWKRILKPSPNYAKPKCEGKRINGYDYEQDAANGMKVNQKVNAEYITVGWRATRAHADLEPIPCTVLDVFSGAGTTGMVARRLQRHYVGIDLNSTYIEMSADRIIDDAPLFNQVVAPAVPSMVHRPGEVNAEK